VAFVHFARFMRRKQRAHGPQFPIAYRDVDAVASEWVEPFVPMSQVGLVMNGLPSSITKSCACQTSEGMDPVLQRHTEARSIVDC
jgi:hypothetical protein